MFRLALTEWTKNNTIFVTHIQILNAQLIVSLAVNYTMLKNHRQLSASTCTTKQSEKQILLCCCSNHSFTILTFFRFSFFISAISFASSSISSWRKFLFRLCLVTPEFCCCCFLSFRLSLLFLRSILRCLLWDHGSVCFREVRLFVCCDFGHTPVSL